MCTINHVHCVLCVIMIYIVHITIFSVNTKVRIREIFIPHQICQNMLLPAWNEEQAAASWTIWFRHLTCRTENKTQAFRARERVCESEIRLSVLIISVLYGRSMEIRPNPKRPAQTCLHQPGRAFSYKSSALLLLLVAANRFHFAMTHFTFKRLTILSADVPHIKIIHDMLNHSTLWKLLWHSLTLLLG